MNLNNLHLGISFILLFTFLCFSCQNHEHSEKSSYKEKNLKDQSSIDRRSSYLPLVKGSTYKYQGRFNNKITEETCRVKKIVNNENQTLYYFLDDRNTVYSNVFGEGLYRHKDDYIMTIYVRYSPENIRYLKKESIEHESILLPEKPIIGSEFKSISRDGAWKTLIEISAFEDITVPAGTFDDCLKINCDITWTRNGEVESETAWFKENVGMIKWIRSTGRIDELVEYYIPNNN